MDRDRRFDSVFSKKVNAGKRRTYFFDVRQTKGDDYFLTLTESTKRFNGEGHERHKIFLYKEDFNRFLSSLEEVIKFVKTELMPDYDYEEFDKYYEEDDNSGGYRNDFRGDRGGDRERDPRPPRQQRHFREDSSRQADGETEEDTSQWRKPSQPTPPTPPRRDTKFDDDLSW